jgi:hypothetical protein
LSPLWYPQRKGRCLDWHRPLLPCVFYMGSQHTDSQYSDKATSWMVLDSNPIRGKRFFSSPDQLSAPPNLLHIGYRTAFPEVKWPGREVDNTSSSTTEDKNGWSYIPTPSIRLHGTGRKCFIYVFVASQEVLIWKFTKINSNHMPFPFLFQLCILVMKNITFWSSEYIYLVPVYIFSRWYYSFMAPS